MDRLKIFQLAIAILFILITARLFYWQILVKTTTDSITRQDQIPAPRGQIYTSDNFAIVANQQAFLIYAQPHQIKDAQKTATALAPYLISEKYATASAVLSDDQKKQKEQEITTKQESLFQKLTNKNLLWVQLARKVPLTAKEQIEKLNLFGIGFEPDTKRIYPEASMAAQLLGFVGSDKFGNDTGYFGIEGYYDRRLRGKPGRLTQQEDPFGIPILVGQYRPITPRPGTSLYLSIDRAVQFMVEDKLSSAVQKYAAQEGTVIIAEPKTGKIIAMATYPAYHPGLREEFSEKLYKNPAIADAYEPGSIFKLITTSAALDHSVITPNSICEICTGPRQIGGFEISTWNKKYYPNSTVTEIIEHSDNIGMTYVADKLGVDKLYEYIVKFGFGQPTGIDLQEEAAGSIRPKNEWRPIDLATASFGQGLAVTPIQMVQAVSAIAAGGKLQTPKIINIIKDQDNRQIVEPEQSRQVISPRTASQITEMMVESVQKGEAKAYAPKGWRIAGKTGTAQIPLAGHYDPDKTIASFVGFAPADDPRFVMLVRFTQPQSSPYGSETAAPTFFEIAKELFNYYGIPPQK